MWPSTTKMAGITHRGQSCVKIKFRRCRFLAIERVQCSHVAIFFLFNFLQQVVGVRKGLRPGIIDLPGDIAVVDQLWLFEVWRRDIFNAVLDHGHFSFCQLLELSFQLDQSVLE